MNKPTPRSLSFPLNVIVVAVLLFAANPGAAQETLRRVVENTGAQWIVGHWTGTNSRGQAVELEYEWALEGHLLELELTVGSDAYKGLISFSPTEGSVVEFGTNNRGGMTRAIWREEAGALISERTLARPEGGEIKVAVRTQQMDAETLKATVHALSPDGTLSNDPTETVVLQRVTEPEGDD